MRMVHRLLALVVAFCPAVALAEETSPAEKKLEAGHSAHGEVFNEGPRQKAYLMGGTGPVHFEVTSSIPQVQEFINQGVGQLHGYWYFEAERSFRQAAMLDPNCAIAYWGMSLANTSNSTRAKGFLAEAMKRRHHASKRERMYIEATDAYKNGKGSRKQKAVNYVKALETIAKENPDDLEALAFRAYALYKYRSTLGKKYDEVNKAIGEVLAKERLHPVHHFRIHLWDSKDAKRALESSALAGEGTPAIAHMWHMPGHIYSKLKRYEDAVYQQEASARVDHAHMMRDRVLPDQIHNFAHNNEWLIRNLVYLGRVDDALSLAENMTSLPMHPKYNSMKKRGSHSYGRTRLYQVITQFELWPEFVRLADTHLQITGEDKHDLARSRHLGVAYAMTGETAKAEQILEALKQELDKKQAEYDKAKADAEAKRKAEEAKRKAEEAKRRAEREAKRKAEEAKRRAEREAKRKAEEEAKKKAEEDKKDDKKPEAKPDERKTEPKKPEPQRRPPRRRPRPRRIPDPTVGLKNAVAHIEGALALYQKDYKKAEPLLKKCGAEFLTRVRVQALAGDTDGAIKALEGKVKSSTNQVLPLAALTEVFWIAEQKDKAKETFDKLREISGKIQFSAPIYERLAPIAKEFGYPTDWRIEKPLAKDIGKRPNLDDLGPFRWQPSPALPWSLQNSEGATVSLDDYKGKPVIVIFYLGYGCLHCAQQLEAFAPMTEKFKAAGISLVAISTDDMEGLKHSQDNYKKGTFPFPLLTDAKLDTFKAYRSYDDFEKMPLHGTFLIDSNGRVRWQDISFEPFMDAEFVLKESQRLLAQK